MAVLLICVACYGAYTVYRKGFVNDGLSDSSGVPLKTEGLSAVKEGVEHEEDYVAARPDPATTRQAVENGGLHVDFKFWYRPPKKPDDATGQSTGVVLTSSEPYYLTVEPSEICYLYILQRRSSGRVVMLFPNKKYSPMDNPISPMQLRIPDEPHWIYLDDRTGAETIYLVAAKHLQSELDVFMQSLNLPPMELETILGELSQKALNDPELVYSEYLFQHRE